MDENSNVGKKIYDLAERIFPIFRCLTGQGVRDTLAILSDYIEKNTGRIIDMHAVKSGTQVFDWNIPKEWRINAAYIEDEDGKRIVDIDDNNLHVVGYSMPVNKWVDKEELLKYIYVQDDQPEVIPYVTSYYEERIGFCMSKKQRDSLSEGRYHMYIDSELFDGEMTYGEVYIPGETDEEIFFSTYICHPSMANNECSGPALMSELICYIAGLKKRYYSYRFIYIPETIGSITYIYYHKEKMQSKIIAGFNLTCVGDDREYSMIHTRYADTISDRVLSNVLKTRGSVREYSFLERGSDERQYNSPLVNLPIVTFCRSKFHTYSEYHTSADNMSLVSENGFQGSYDVLAEVVEALEHNGYYIMQTFCEPQLGKRDLYPTLSKKGSSNDYKAMMDFMAYADGKNDLIDISNIIEVPIKTLIDIVAKLSANELLEYKR